MFAFSEQDWQVFQFFKLWNEWKNVQNDSFATLPQLPERLVSLGDICKKLSHHFLLHFSIGMSSYDHHAKYQGVFP